MNASKVSIITVTYNAENLLEGTIKSVLEQSYPSIEYLVIDGKSSDNTLQIIKQYESKIDYWISEPDAGLYDAMNKGLAVVTGDFVLFLNAGDLLFDQRTLEKVMNKTNEKTDVLYGKTMLIDANQQPLGLRSKLTTRKLPKRLTWKDLSMGMVVCHQSILVRRSIAPTFMTDNLSADIDWVIGALKKSKATVYVDEIVAKYLIGGISKQKHFQSLKDRFSIFQKHFGLPATIFNHLRILVRAVYFKLSTK